MDLFDKCYSFTRADETKSAGLYPYFHPIQENEGPEVTLYGKKMLMAGSNNYLGLTTHPKVKEAALNAIKKYGTGCSGSRYLTGTLDLHLELESRIAKFLGYEAVLLFSTGYQTSIGVIPTMLTKGDYLILDKEDHGCIMYAGVLAKGFMINMVRYKHNDMEDLEKVLSKLPEDAGKFIVSDGVFSVTGELVNLPKLIEIKNKYNARLLIDDAHGLGVIGKGGRGTPSHFGLEKETDLLMGTFSKTLASLGGYIAAPERVVNYIKHFSSPLIFSASPTPASCAASLAALEVLEEHPELVEKLLHNVQIMRTGFKDLGFNIIDSQTAIIAIIVGEIEKTLVFWRKLFDNGVYINVFVPPGVPPHMSMIRTSYMASHKEEHLYQMLDIFKKVGKELGII